MSDIIFTCQHCGQWLVIDAQAVGLEIDCSRCHKQLIVPDASTESLPEEPGQPLAKTQLLSEPETETAGPLAVPAEPSGQPMPPSEPEAGTAGSPDAVRPDQPAALPMPPRRAPRQGLFTFLRLLIVVVSLGMIGSMILAGIHLQKLRILLAHQVSYQDIQKALLPAAAAAQPQKPGDIPQLQVPDAIKKYYPGRSSRELLEWLEKTDPEKRADFVANLAAVIKEAEAQKAPDMRAVIAEYLRQKKMTPDFRATDAYSARPAILALLSFVIFLIGMLLAFFCLLLIVLAAERKAHVSLEPMPPQ
jgi:hypothetical protein